MRREIHIPTPVRRLPPRPDFAWHFSRYYREHRGRDLPADLRPVFARMELQRITQGYVRALIDSREHRALGIHHPQILHQALADYVAYLSRKLRLRGDRDPMTVISANTLREARVLANGDRTVKLYSNRSCRRLRGYALEMVLAVDFHRPQPAKSRLALVDLISPMERFPGTVLIIEADFKHRQHLLDYFNTRPRWWLTLQVDPQLTERAQALTGTTPLSPTGSSLTGTARRPRRALKPPQRRLTPVGVSPNWDRPDVPAGRKSLRIARLTPTPPKIFPSFAVAATA